MLTQINQAGSGVTLRQGAQKVIFKYSKFTEKLRNLQKTCELELENLYFNIVKDINEENSVSDESQSEEWIIIDE